MAEFSHSIQRLETWKEVAGYLGKNERTVKRWEAERGLPVHRLPGGPRSRIYAHASELDAWLKGGAADGAQAPTPRRRIQAIGLALAMIAVIGGSAAIATSRLASGLFGDAFGKQVADRAAARARPPPVEAQRAYVEATEAWTRRTPASLNEALTKYAAAVQRDPDYAEAYVGLAKTYLLLREYTVLPDSQAYPLAAGAAQRAIALDDRLPEAHAAIGFVAGNWSWDFPRAEREFRRAIALDRRDPTAHHWFATYLLDMARLDEAEREIDIALALAPGSPAIQADRALILYCMGRPAAAIAQLSRLEAADRDFRSPHQYLAMIYFAQGRDREFFEESAFAARLSDDLPQLAVIEAGQRGLAQGGHEAALQAMRAVQIRQLQYGAGSAFAIARTDAVLGNDDEACHYLQLSRRRREPLVLGAAAGPDFARLRQSHSCDAIEATLRG